jgi:hypothetical protein
MLHLQSFGTVQSRTALSLDDSLRGLEMVLVIAIAVA